MYYAMRFELIEGMYTVRTVRTNGYKSLEAAKKALVKSGNEGYIKKLGSKQPVWENVVR